MYSCFTYTQQVTMKKTTPAIDQERKEMPGKTLTKIKSYIYLRVFIWSSLLYKSKRRLAETKEHSNFFNLFKSKQLANLQKEQLQKFFLQCVCYRCNLLQWIFFVPCDNWNTLLFLKVCHSCEIFSTAILPFSLKQVSWKKPLF